MNLDPDKKTYFLTVPHTFTNSTRMLLDKESIKYRFTHFEKIYEIKIDGVLKDHNVITTYRDPFLVAASWANRMKWNALRKRRFMGNWTRWGLVVPHAVKIYVIDDMIYWKNKGTFGDTSGAVLALTEKNWNRYFEIIPRELIEHAYGITNAAGYTSQYEAALSCT